MNEMKTVKVEVRVWSKIRNKRKYKSNGNRETIPEVVARLVKENKPLSSSKDHKGELKQN